MAPFVFFFKKESSHFLQFEIKKNMIVTIKILKSETILCFFYIIKVIRCKSYNLCATHVFLHDKKETLQTVKEK